MALGLLDGEPERRDDRLSRSRIREEDERCVGAAQGARRLERSGEHLVEVDRPGELAECPTPAPFLLGALERSLELSAELVHPVVQACDDVCHALLGRGAAPHPSHEQPEQEEHESSQSGAGADQDRRHRFKGPQNLPGL